VIVATFPVVEAASADTGRRRVEGVAVPWGVEGRVASGELVRFHPGSLDAGARPVALRDHDRTRTIGRVVDAGDDGRQMRAALRVAATPLGDESLVLAGDGALMFSVGADPTEFSYDARGVLDVFAADWHELSLLPIGAYPGAVVTHVAASHPEGDPMNPLLTDTPPDDPEAPQLPEDPDNPDDAEAPEDPDEVETRATPVPIAAARGARRGNSPRRGPYDGYTLRDVARVITAARGGAPDDVVRLSRVLAAQGPAVRGVEAALLDVTLVGADNIASAYRPAYQAELVDIISWGTPLIDTLRQGDLQRGDYPTKSFNSWAKTPEVRLQAAEKDPIHSVAVSIVPASTPVQTWAGGNDISQQTVDLGSPSFVEDYIRAAGADYALQAETYAATTLLAAALDVPAIAGAAFLDVVAGLIGALNPATTPPGGLFCAVAYDVGVGLIGLTRDQGPAFWDGHVNFGRMTPEVTTDAGLTVFVDPVLAPGTYLAGHKDGATWYDLPGTPFNLRAANVGLLGLDVAVYGYGALGIQYPGAFTKTVVPPGP
jgi:hypothetical protein